MIIAKTLMMYRGISDETVHLIRNFNTFIYKFISE